VRCERRKTGRAVEGQRGGGGGDPERESGGREKAAWEGSEEGGRVREGGRGSSRRNHEVRMAIFLFIDGFGRGTRRRRCAEGRVKLEKPWEVFGWRAHFFAPRNLCMEY
jgi:hypothetical protein